MYGSLHKNSYFAIKMVRLNTNEESRIALPYRFQTVWLPMVMFYDFIEW